MPTTREILEANKHLFWPVPSRRLVSVCSLCYSAIGETFTYCFACNKFRKAYWSSWGDRVSVVPMTIAKNPSHWYSALLKYKNTQFAEYAAIVASLAYEWLTAHDADLTELLGGEATHLTIVPSKNVDATFEAQKLRRALALVRPIGDRLQELLRCTVAPAARLKECDPSVFETVANVEGARVILIEDTWISGSTALSAAGTLIEEGAASVVIAPLAREIKLSFHGEGHPYLEYLVGDYDVKKWPH